MVCPCVPWTNVEPCGAPVGTSVVIQCVNAGGIAVVPGSVDTIPSVNIDVGDCIVWVVVVKGLVEVIVVQVVVVILVVGAVDVVEVVVVSKATVSTLISFTTKSIGTVG